MIVQMKLNFHFAALPVLLISNQTPSTGLNLFNLPLILLIEIFQSMSGQILKQWNRTLWVRKAMLHQL